MIDDGMNQYIDSTNDAHDEGDDPRDVVLDALLRETLGGQSPPDLKAKILDRLRSEDTQSAVTPPPVVQPVAAPTAKPQTLTWLMAAATLAASIAVGVVLVKQNRGLPDGLASPSDGLASDNQIVQTIPKPAPAMSQGFTQRETTMATDPNSLASDASPRENVADNRERREPTAPPNKPFDANSNSRTLATGSDGSTNVVSDTGPGQSSIDLESLASQNRPTLPSSSRPNMVADRVETALVSYWDSIGVQPTEAISDEALVALLNDRLGVRFAAEDIADVEQVRRRLKAAPNARMITQRFLRQLTGLGPDPINAEAFRGVRRAFENCFQGGAEIDSLLSTLITGKHPNSGQWYAAMGQAGRHGMIQRMASVTMDQQLGCLRCHDAKIETRGNQADYWAFAGMFQHGLRRDPKTSVWQVVPNTAKPNAENSNEKPNLAPSAVAEQNVFYDALDGRRVMVNAGVPKRWFVSDAKNVSTRDEIVPANLVQWGRSLRGSQQLAAGLVNELWKMVHDRWG